MPLRCLIQFFPDERKDQLLRGRMFCVPFTDGGGLVFIVDVFPNWMMMRILSYWTEDFLSLSLSDKYGIIREQLLRIILVPLLVRFDLIL